MIVSVKWAALKQTHSYEYVVRFALGGLATVFAGVIAEASLVRKPAVCFWPSRPSSVPAPHSLKNMNAIKKPRKGFKGKNETGVRQRLMPSALVGGASHLQSLPLQSGRWHRMGRRPHSGWRRRLGFL